MIYKVRIETGIGLLEVTTCTTTVVGHVCTKSGVRKTEKSGIGVIGGSGKKSMIMMTALDGAFFVMFMLSDFFLFRFFHLLVF